MKRSVFLLLASFLLSVPMVLAAAPAAPAASGSIGLLFDAKNLLLLSGFEDGYQAGAGVKYWATQSVAARALVGAYHNTAPNSGPSTTTLGLGFAGEWHPRRGDVSPYVGTLVGTRMLAVTGQTTAFDFYFGGLFGVEAKLVGPISLFAEYDLVASVDANGFSVNFGIDSTDKGQALLGMIIYF